MKNFLVVTVASIVAVFLILLLIRLRYDRLVKEIWRSLKTQPSDLVFTEEMVADLDEPVRRYFLHAIASRTPLATYVELKMSGSFRSKPDVDWLPMQASQIVSSAKGFVWKANIGKNLMKFGGADYYAWDRGRVIISLWGLIPLVDARDENIHRSSAGRLASEYIWLPSALLPQNGVAWQVISDNTIQADFKIDNKPITLTLTIDAGGKLLEMSLPRWGDKTETGDWQYLPFGGEIGAEKTFDGYTIPVKIRAGWWFGTDKYWAFFQTKVERAKFY